MRSISQFDINSSQVLDIRVGFDSKMVADSSFTDAIEKQQFHLYQKRILTGSDHKIGSDDLSIPASISDLGRLFLVDGKSILFLDKKPLLKNKVRVDYLIIDGRSLKFDKIQFEKLNAGKVILGTDLWNRTEEEINTYLIDKNKPFHSIRSDGYFSHIWKK